MDRQVDVTIEAEIQGLAEQYASAVWPASAVIAERVAKDPAGASVYLLVDTTAADRRQPERLAGAGAAEDGWTDFALRQRGRTVPRSTAPARTFLLSATCGCSSAATSAIWRRRAPSSSARSAGVCHIGRAGAGGRTDDDLQHGEADRGHQRHQPRESWRATDAAHPTSGAGDD